MDFRRRSGMVGVVAGVLVTACTHTAPAGGAPKPAAAPARDSARVAAVPSAPRYVAGRAAYRIASRATVVVAGDSAHHDTVSTQAVVRYESRWTGAGFEVNGSVVAGTGAAVPFSATVDTATAHVRMGSDSVSCPAPNSAALATVRELLAGGPRSLVPGATWTDTVMTSTCRGEIPVTTTAVRHFTVTSDGAAILVAHTTSAELAGTTTKGGVRIELTGHGDGRANQRYQPQTGRLLDGLSTVDVDLRVGAAGHPVALTQHAETRVTPADAP
jgi:hypothetical protein